MYNIYNFIKHTTPNGKLLPHLTVCEKKRSNWTRQNRLFEFGYPRRPRVNTVCQHVAISAALWSDEA